MQIDTPFNSKDLGHAIWAQLWKQYTHARTHARMHAQTHKLTDGWAESSTQACTQSQMHARIHACTHASARAHAHMRLAAYSNVSRTCARVEAFNTHSIDASGTPPPPCDHRRGTPCVQVIGQHDTTDRYNVPEVLKEYSVDYTLDIANNNMVKGCVAWRGVAWRGVALPCLAMQCVALRACVVGVHYVRVCVRAYE